MNKLILNLSSTIDEQDIDFLSYYINFLKTIANKLDINTLSFFFHKEYNIFPLLDEASQFFKFNDVMIKNTARNIFLSLIKLNYLPMIQYVCNIPRITDLLLLCDNIKSYIIYMVNDNNIKNSERFKEIEEYLVDDILFIQDILSIGIKKINYIIINCLFSIPLRYLFYCILSHKKINICFYILNLFLKNIENDCINNLITFILYSSKINSKLHDFITYKESQEIYNLLYLNKFLSHHLCANNLLFDEYIILVYSKPFLKSIPHIKQDFQIYQEIKEISDYIQKKDNDIRNEDINIYISIISEIINRNNKNNNKIYLNKIIQKMELYHNLISRYTGINIGISKEDANFSFLKIIYDNFDFYKDYTNINKNSVCLIDNLIQKECLYYIDCNNVLYNQCYYINQILLILQIINSNKISSELKKILCLNKYINIDNNNDNNNKNNSKFESNNSEENNINQIKDIINNNEINNNNEKLIFRNLRFKYNIENNDSSLSSLNNIIKDFFGSSETKTDFNMLNNYFNNSLYEDIPSSSLILLPRPINSNHDDIPGFNLKKNILINNIKMKFDDFDFSINNLNKIFLIYNSDKNNLNNNEMNIKFHDLLLQKIIDIIFNKEEKILTKISIRLTLELIENLMLGINNNDFYINKYKDILIFNFYKIINDINNILLKSNSTKTKIYKFAYQYFEEGFILNKKKFEKIFNEYITQEYEYLLLNKIKNNNFELFNFPNHEYEILECLFQLLLGLYDLLKLMGLDIKDIKNENISLLRNIEFPIQLINSNFCIGKTINIKELKISPVKILYKAKDIEYPDFYIFNYLNYLFIASDANKDQDNNYFLIRNRIPLRQIMIGEDRGEPRSLYLLKGSNLEATLFFDDYESASDMKENLNNAIKLANLKEFSEVKRFINNLLKK